MNVVVTCGVSYNRDLTHVERVVLEIAQETIDESPYAVDNADPFSVSQNLGNQT